MKMQKSNKIEKNKKQLTQEDTLFETFLKVNFGDKNHSLDFIKEKRKLFDNLRESDTKAKKFYEEYKLKHKFCPKCGCEKYSTTLVGYVLNIDKVDEYKDLNVCKCLNCGNTHVMHDRIENNNIKKKKTGK